MRVLELFCGIGGCTEALSLGSEVVLAIDHDRLALSVYEANHPHPTRVQNLSSARASSIPAADLWWMSPPCQPYTVRGARRDLDDRRADSLKHVLKLVQEFAPPAIALENVPFFAGSRAHALVREVLLGSGYRVAERMLCPSELGVPGQRRRFYLVAAKRLGGWRPAQRPLGPLAAYLDAEPDPSLFLGADLLARFGTALHVVDRDDPTAVAACFTSAYGNSPVYAGSYLREGDRLRHFAPREIARLMGFGKHFALPPDLPLRKGWGLVGNSLAVQAVRVVLGAVEA